MRLLGLRSVWFIVGALYHGFGNRKKAPLESTAKVVSRSECRILVASLQEKMLAFTQEASISRSFRRVMRFAFTAKAVKYA